MGAYYALASGAVIANQTYGALQTAHARSDSCCRVRAIDRSHQSAGLGRTLVRDAGLRVVQAADAIGIRGMVVRGLSELAKGFYQRLGFSQSPLDPMTLDDLRASIPLCVIVVVQLAVFFKHFKKAIPF